MDLREQLRDLYLRVPRGMRLGLPAMQDACAQEGHPENTFEVIHVAGTNGKGSTCTMVEAMLRAAGRHTGLYTSPHLCSFAERIRINGSPVHDGALSDTLRRALGHQDLSFFEVATLAAFLAFREAGIDTCVLEVGIGGRLDATNVVTKPKATAITRVAFDHMDKLGDTLVAIAREKAGIAKREVPLVLGPLGDEVQTAVRAIAGSVGAPIVLAAESSRAHDLVDASELALPGAHQRDNALVATELALLVGVDGESVREGLRKATIAGRLEHIHASDGPYLLDGAHNPDGAETLAAYLRDAREPPASVVFGAMADKPYAQVFDLVGRDIKHRVFVAPEGRAPAPPATLAAQYNGHVAGSVPDALARARSLAGPRGLVLVTGSLYLVGHARAHLLGLPRDVQVGL
jgi:dihydrofolate synthase / folylpolyglutamate synthase